MKELNTFRKFLAEGSSKLMSQGEYWVKNNDLGPKTTTADIEKWVSDNFEKYAKPGDDKAKIIADLAAYNDGLNKSLNEGTWSYGSENQMIKALEEMNAMMMHSDPRQLKAGLDAMDNALYRIFGDDSFHDEFSNAKSHAVEGDLDRAKNALGDAMAIGKKMITDIHGMEDGLEEEEDFETALPGEKGYDSTKLALSQAGIPEGIGENDTVLDEIIGESKEDLTKSILKKHPKKYKDEKAVTAAAAKLMKDPKFKARYKGKKGVDFIIHTLKTLERGK